MPFAIHFRLALAPVALFIGVTAGCSDQKPQDQNNSSAIEQIEPQAVDLTNITLPVPRPPLDRTALIVAANQAASDYARGPAVDPANTLSGQPFSLRLPFGCAGPSESPSEPGLAAVRPGKQTGALQLELGPADWTEVEWLVGNAPVDRIEGYWIDRPWLVTSECPATGTASQIGTKSPQTLGIAYFHGEESSRIGRRDTRAYNFVVRPQEEVRRPVGEAPPGPGIAKTAAKFAVVMSGRIAAFANGRSIRCHANGLAERPVCIVAVLLDRVAFESADGEVLSEWRTG